MKPGLHRGLSYDDYAAIPALRASTLQLFNDRTPAHARYDMLHPKDAQHFIVGSATHRAILEPQLFDSTYVVAPKVDLRTNVGKAAWGEFQAQNVGRTVLRAEEYDQLSGMVAAVQEHPLAREILAAPGHTEVSLVWTDPDTELLCKGRPDALRQCEVSTLVDVKTARTAHPQIFAADAWRHGYPIQAAHQLAGADVLAPVARRYLWIVVEKTPPFCVAVYEMDAKLLELAFAARAKTIKAYKKCVESDTWPGYGSQVNTLYAPGFVDFEDEHQPLEDL